jgi:hypothetical protein
MILAGWVRSGAKPMPRPPISKPRSKTSSAANTATRVRVVGFNTVEGWSQDVSADVAQELRPRCDLQLRDVPSSIQDFVERHEGHDRRLLTLRLA